jgi:hypothetical protein
MKTKRALLPLMAAMAGMICSAHGQDDATPESAQNTPPASDDRLYHACEFSVDAFGVGILDEYNLTHGELAEKNFRWGGGAGANFFLTRYIGIGGDFYSRSWKGSFVDTTTGNLIVRIPIELIGIAPYVFGGAGYQFQGVDQIVADGGAGIEFRPVRHFGIFVDARYVAAAKTANFGFGRAGIRLSF